MLIHEITVALIIGSIQSFVFVEVDGRNLRKIQIPVFIHGNKGFIGADGGRTGGKTKNTVGLGDYLGSDDICRLTAEFLIIFYFVHFHNLFPLLYVNICITDNLGLSGIYRSRSDSALIDEAYSEGVMPAIFLNCLEK